MTSSLYRWPDAAAFGRVVPKTKFYEHATVKTKLRDKFVDQVRRVTWAYKLADVTIHLKASPQVPEIQVFTIDLKDDELSDDVLAAIDKAVQTPIVFEVHKETSDRPQARITAAHKQIGHGRPKLSGYFTSDWLAMDSPRQPLPTALDLAGLYTQLMAPLLPVPPRTGEGLAEATERVAKVRKLEREIAALEKRMRNEPQLNRQLDLRRQLRERTDAVTALTYPEFSTTEDA